jgi:hypothetical protein
MVATWVVQLEIVALDLLEQKRQEHGLNQEFRFLWKELVLPVAG